MNRCSEFIKGKALFGSFPTQEAVEELEKAGVRIFVDLTSGAENKTIPYTTKYKYISYPIQDRKTPSDWKSYSKFIVTLSHEIKNLRNKDKIYIHCKGGHGRSGVVVASLLAYVKKVLPEVALQKTGKYHNNRSEMRDKWRVIGSPQTRVQKNFIYRFFETIYFNRKTIYYSGFSNSSDNFHISIAVNGNNKIFTTAEDAYKELYNGKQSRETCMAAILELKFTQNEDLKDLLINTHLKPLIHYSKDSYWGCGLDGKGENMLGKLLELLREKFILQLP